jgi:hypothetical protein
MNQNEILFKEQNLIKSTPYLQITDSGNLICSSIRTDKVFTSNLILNDPLLSQGIGIIYTDPISHKLTENAWGSFVSSPVNAGPFNLKGVIYIKYQNINIFGGMETKPKSSTFIVKRPGFYQITCGISLLSSLLPNDRSGNILSILKNNDMVLTTKIQIGSKETRSFTMYTSGVLNLQKDDEISSSLSENYLFNNFTFTITQIGV